MPDYLKGFGIMLVEASHRLSECLFSPFKRRRVRASVPVDQIVDVLRSLFVPTPRARPSRGWKFACGIRPGFFLAVAIPEQDGINPG